MNQSPDLDLLNSTGSIPSSAKKQNRCWQSLCHLPRKAVERRLLLAWIRLLSGYSPSNLHTGGEGMRNLGNDCREVGCYGHSDLLSALLTLMSPEFLPHTDCTSAGLLPGHREGAARRKQAVQQQLSLLPQSWEAVRRGQLLTSCCC